MPGAQILDNVQLLNEGTTPSKTGQLLRNGDDLQFCKSTGAKSIPTLTNTTLFTAGSVPFTTGAAGELLQDNSNFFWDNTNKRLGIATAAAPATTLDIGAKFQVRNTAQVVTITQPVQTGGTAPALFTATGGAHSAVDSAEVTDVIFNLQRTVNINAPGFATQRAFRIRPATYAFTGGASVIADADTVTIEGPPNGSGTATLTEACALSLETRALTGVTNGYALHCDAPSGATNNYSARFTGRTLFNTATTAAATAQVLIATAADANKGLVVQGFSGTQSANLIEGQLSTGTVAFAVTPAGNLTIRQIAYTWPAADGAGYLQSNGSGTLTWTAGTAALWNAIGNPSGNQSLNMFSGATPYTTTWTWNASTGASNLVTLTDTATNGSATGTLFTLATTAGSTLIPFKVKAVGGDSLTVNSAGVSGFNTATFQTYLAGYSVVKLGANNYITFATAGGNNFISSNQYLDSGGTFKQLTAGAASTNLNISDSGLIVYTSPNVGAGVNVTNTSRFAIATNGNIGISVAPSTPRLAVLQSGTDWAGYFVNTAAAGSNFGLDVVAGTNASDTAFQVRNAIDTLTYFKVQGDGNVGIGTTSPGTYNGSQSALEIKSTEGHLALNTQQMAWMPFRLLILAAHVIGCLEEALRVFFFKMSPIPSRFLT